MRLLCLAFLFLFGLVPRCYLSAQDPYAAARPAMRLYAGGEGLPGDAVYDFLLDAQGRLWAGTLEGPAYFNGSRWVPVPFPEGASSQQVRALLQSRDGSLWFGTLDGGVWRLNGGTWTPFTAGQHLSSNRINCLLETEEQGKRTLWVGTAGGGIVRYTDGIWSDPDRGLGLGDPWIWKLRAIKDGNGKLRIWAGTRDGLWTLADGRWTSIGAEQGFLAKSVNDLVELPGEDGRPMVWASCWGSGIARWDGHRWEHFGPGNGFPSRFPTSLCVTRDVGGKPVIWAGTFDRGVAWLEGGRWQSFSPQQGFPVVGAYALAAAPGGRPTVWVGTRGAGVVALDLAGWRTMDMRHGLPGTEVKTLAEFPEPGGTSTLWAGTTRGVAHWVGGRWQLEGAAEGQPSNYVFHLARAGDARGRSTLWAGTLAGLLRREGNAWVPEASPVLPRTTVDVLLEAELEPGKPSFWAGYNTGLASLQGGRWSFFTTADGLPGNWILSLCASLDRDGGRSLWIGTRGQGVGRLKAGRWSVYGAGSGLPALSVQGLLATRSSDGRTWLWAGTQGGGLARLEADRGDAFWEAISLGERGRSIVGLAQDRIGRLYITTTRGVFRCRLEERLGVPWPASPEHFNTGDGLPTDTIQDNALFLDHDGRVWVGTARGAAVLDPTREPRIANPPMPTLERVDASGRLAKGDAGLEFSHRETRLVFQFAFHSYHRREDARFRSWIEGFEREPTAWGRDDVRELTGLPAGSYVLHVWAKDYSEQVTAPLKVSFRIRPAPWRSGWAYAFYALMFATGVVSIVRIRTAFLRRRQRVLEARVMKALAEVKTLQGLLPICSYCKKIRDDQGAWDPLEHYLGEHSGVLFSHGVCPDCRVRLLGESEDSGKT